jgi:tetratricopeptide (TPR) repeat protein
MDHVMASDPTGQVVDVHYNAKVFVSYSRQDICFADRLEAALKARGFEPLIDRSEIYAFEEWWSRVETLIASADTVVFVLSPDAVASDVARREVSFAASLNKRFAPVVCRPVDDGAVPEALAKLNFIFFHDAARFEDSADRLAQALNTDIAWIRRHTEFGDHARRWGLAKRPTGLLLRSPLLEEAERWIAARPRRAPAPTEETHAFIQQSRQGATRRRNLLTGSLAAGLMLALALAGLAYWQRGAAVEQRTIAQRNEAQVKEQIDYTTRNFKVAQKTAESLIFEITHALRNAQGMGPETVRKILEASRATFEQLANSVSTDLALEKSRLMILAQFADVYLSLGDLDQALEAYRQALAIHPLMADPSNTRWEGDQAQLHEKVGDVLVAQGKLDEALKAYREGLVRRFSEVVNLLLAQGKLDEALEAYRKGPLSPVGSPPAIDESNTERRHDLADGYKNLATVYLQLGKTAEALAALRKGRDIMAALVPIAPSDVQWKTELAWFDGEIARAQGRE